MSHEPEVLITLLLTQAVYRRYLPWTAYQWLVTEFKSQSPLPPDVMLVSSKGMT